MERSFKKRWVQGQQTVLELVGGKNILVPTNSLSVFFDFCFSLLPHIKYICKSCKFSLKIYQKSNHFSHHHCSHPGPNHHQNCKGILKLVLASVPFMISSQHSSQRDHLKTEVRSDTPLLKTPILVFSHFTQSQSQVTYKVLQESLHLGLQ